MKYGNRLSVHVYLDDEEYEALEKMRGDDPRSHYVRKLIKREAKKEGLS